MSREYIVRVPVATIWTNPEAPRKIDEKAVSYPLEMKDWLKEMTTEERRLLCDNNLVQSQVLYGQQVTVKEEKGEWFHVLVPEQPSSKDDGGYPGWLPKNQVISREKTDVTDTTASVAVTAQTAWLYEGTEPVLEVSFQTRLPLVNETEDWITVKTPDGDRLIKAADAEVIDSQEESENVNGEKLVETGAAFLGLQYLWGGMSGFGFDCSGFTYTIHRAFGITIPRDASDQARQGELVERASLKKGDCLYFAKEEGQGRVYHVGMYYGDNKMIHAPSTGKGIEVVEIGTTKYNKDYCTARRFW